MQLYRRLPVRLRRSALGRAGLAMIVAGGVCVALAGCGGASGSSGNDGNGTLVIYSAQHPETTAALVAAFTKQTGIKVQLKNDDEDVLTAQIEQEGSRSPADVFFTENSNWLQQLDDKGLLANVDASTLARVPSRDNAANGRLARGLGSVQRAHLQPRQDPGVAAAHVRHAARRPALQGQAGAGAGRDRLLADRQLDHPRARAARRRSPGWRG